MHRPQSLYPDGFVGLGLGLQLRFALRSMRNAFTQHLANSGVPWSAWYALRALVG